MATQLYSKAQLAKMNKPAIIDLLLEVQVQMVHMAVNAEQQAAPKPEPRTSEGFRFVGNINNTAPMGAQVVAFAKQHNVPTTKVIVLQGNTRMGIR